MKTLKRLAMYFVALVVLALGPIGTTWAQVQVTSADPSSTIQGTVSLDVAVNGNGFDSSAAVKFLVTGTTDTGGIVVKKVSVRGSRKLVVTIDVSDTAVVNKFDIEVALSDGRKGKGTTLFTVQPKSVSSGDPCATPGLDFPAFTYWQQSGKQSQQYFVADSTGKCSRPLMTFASGGAGASRFSIVGSSNVGRVVFVDGNGLAAIEFTFHGTDISVGPKRVLVASAYTSWRTSELSADGEYLYYATNPFDAAGQTSHTLKRLYVGTNMPAPPPVDVYTIQPPWLFRSVSVNADETAVFAEISELSGPLQQAIRIDRPPVGWPAPEGAATSILGARPLSALMSPAVDLTAPRIAFTDYLPGLNNCWQIKVADHDGGDLTQGQPHYGRYVTWMSGYVLANSRNPPTGSGRCVDNGYISRIDPQTGEEVYLTRGYDPDGR